MNNFIIFIKAGKVTGDRVWRMPLYNHYTKAIKKSDLADLNNIGGGREAGSCTAAAFLQVRVLLRFHKECFSLIFM